MADKDLQYKITTVADTKGAEQAQRAIEQSGKAAEQASQGSAEAAQAAKRTAEAVKQAGQDGAKALSQQAEVTTQLQGGLNVVGEVLRGNLRALGQFPAVLKGIAASAAANPLFALGAVASAVILPALAKIKDGWEAQRRAADEAGKAAADALNAARAAVGEKRRNAAAEQFAEIAAEAERARTAIDRAAQAQLEMIDAEAAVERALLQARAGLTDAERSLGLADIDRRSRARRQAVELAGIDAGVTEAERAAERARQGLGGFDTLVNAAREKVAQVDARNPTAIRDEITRADEDRARIRQELAGLDPTGREAFAAKQAELAAATQRLADLRTELAVAERDFQGNLEAAQDELTAATRAHAAAQAEAARLVAAAAAAEADAQFRRGSVITRNAAADQVSQIETGPSRERELRRLAAEAEQANARGDFAAQDKAVAARRKLLQAGGAPAGDAGYFGSASAPAGGGDVAVSKVQPVAPILAEMARRDDAALAAIQQNNDGLTMLSRGMRESEKRFRRMFESQEQRQRTAEASQR